MPTRAERHYSAREAVCSQATWGKLDPEIARLMAEYDKQATGMTPRHLRAMAIGHLLALVADAITEETPT